MWSTSGVKGVDLSGTSDVFIRTRFTSSEQKSPWKETDTHWFCAKGNASFNWRIKFPNIKLNAFVKNCMLTFQIWDRNLLGSNEFIADASINFSDIAEKAFQYNLKQIIYDTATKKKMDELEKKNKKSSTKKAPELKFWLETYGLDKNKKKVKSGKVQLQIELITKSDADTIKIGSGRDNPNIEPFLPAPIGRFKLSLNPCSMLLQTLSPAVKRKLCCCCC